MKAISKQLQFGDFFDDFDELISHQKPIILQLFEEYIDVKSFIPNQFFLSYYSNTSHPREYPLESMISAFIFQKFFSIPTTSLLITFLEISSELKDACGFTSIPHKSQFSRFLSDFYHEINLMFHKLVDLTEPICHEIDNNKAAILISDTTGFEGYVKENNPKFFESLLRASKNFAKIYKNDKSVQKFDVYNYAYSNMPKTASSNSDIKLSYLNGHFGYFIKANLVTNELGIVRHIDYYEPVVSADSPVALKDKYDSKTLIPVLENFFSFHPNFNYDIFLGDSGFDAYDNYKYLYSEKNMIPIIQLNPRNQQDLPSPGFNEFGIPTCPNDPSLEMKRDGVSKEKGRSARIKWRCPKFKRVKVNGENKCVLSCDNPCTTSKCGRMVYTYFDKDYRRNTAIPRNSDKWNNLYKIRTICERTIAQLKSLICIKANNLRNSVSIKSNVLFAGITQLISLIILYKTRNISQPMAIKSIA